MAKKRCRHDRVYRERGPLIVATKVKDIDQEGRAQVRRMFGLNVVEVCIRCGSRKWIGSLDEDEKVGEESRASMEISDASGSTKAGCGEDRPMLGLR